jgi:hypothetical protein
MKDRVFLPSAPFTRPLLQRRGAIRVEVKGTINLAAGVLAAAEGQQSVMPADEGNRIIRVEFENLVKDVEHSVKDAGLLTGKAPEISQARKKRFEPGGGLEFLSGPLMITAARLNHPGQKVANRGPGPIGQSLLIHSDCLAAAHRGVKNIAQMNPHIG